MSAREATLKSILKLRAWKLALAGPSLYWYFPVCFVLLATRPTASPTGLAGLFIVLMLSASWGFLINDLADREADSKGGRADALHGHDLSKRVMLSLILATAIGSWVVVFLIGGGYVFKALLALDYFVATVYSVRPPKLKVRKFWGFLANSLMERPLPILVLLTYMNYYSAATLLFPLLMELTWSVFKHQAADVEEDMAAGVTTFAASLGKELSYKIVMRLVNPLSVASLLLLVAYAWLSIPDMRLELALTFFLVLLVITVGFLGELAGKLTLYVTATDPPYIIALNVSYRYVVLPVLAYGVVAMRAAYSPLIVLLAITLAYQTYAYVGIARKGLQKGGHAQPASPQLA